MSGVSNLVADVFVGVGSNIDPVRNTRRALAELMSRFDDVQVSRIFESEPVGFEGDNFLNLVVRFSTELPPRVLLEELRKLEDMTGRVRARINGYDKEFMSRTLDLDILLYGDRVGSVDGLELPRVEITQYAHVLLPLTDLAGDLVHPGSDKTYDQLWRAFDAGDQVLWAVELEEMS